MFFEEAITLLKEETDGIKINRQPFKCMKMQIQRRESGEQKQV